MREWIYGRNPVYEVLRAGRRHCFQLWVAKGAQEKGRLEEIIRICRGNSLPVNFVPRHKLEKFGHPHQGVALEVSGYPYCSFEDMFERVEMGTSPSFFLLLDTLQDPQNLGSLLRTAEAVGVHGVLLPLKRTVTVTPSVVAASSGASEHLLVTQTNLAQAIGTLKHNDIWVVGLDGGQGSQSVNEVNLDGPIAIVVGSEGKGMRRLVRQSCDVLLHFPMVGEIESLNAAVAGSVALYLVLQARGLLIASKALPR
jgi:23S rRNA (guanosine2251-2'-O)-methyltransferase